MDNIESNINALNEQPSPNAEENEKKRVSGYRSAVH